MFLFCLSLLPLSSTLFPYTTLFRSRCRGASRSLLPAPCSLLVPAQPDADHQPVHGLASLVGWRHEHRVIDPVTDRKSTRLNSSHITISYAVFCLKKKNNDSHADCYQ